MAFYSSCIWLCVQHTEGVLEECLIGPLVFSYCKREKIKIMPSPAFLAFITSALWPRFTSPLKAWRSWPRVNIPLPPWSPAPCSHRWWSFHLHVSCWTLHVACPFQIYVCTQAHNVNTAHSGSVTTQCGNLPFEYWPAVQRSSGNHPFYYFSKRWRHCVAVILSWLVHCLLACLCIQKNHLTQSSHRVVTHQSTQCKRSGDLF